MDKSETTEINPGYYFELLDRTHVASTYLQMALGGHPGLARHPGSWHSTKPQSTSWKSFTRQSASLKKPGNSPADVISCMKSSYACPGQQDHGGRLGPEWE
jgi:hypothetical protein